MKTNIIALIMVFSAIAAAAPDKKPIRTPVAAKCQPRWMMQASLSPLLNSLQDPTLIECGKAKERVAIAPVENRIHLSDTLHGAGPKND